MKWFRKAADQGNAEAQRSLGDIFQNGDTEFDKNIGNEAGVHRTTPKRRNGICWLLSRAMPPRSAVLELCMRLV